MLNKLYLMASYVGGPGLLPYHQQHSKCKGFMPIASQGWQPIFSHVPGWPGLHHNIIRPASLNLRLYQLDKQWKAINGFPESSQIMTIDSTFARPVLADTQDNPPHSVLSSFGTSEQSARHEKVIKFVKNGISGTENDGLDFSLMSDLIEFQSTITEMYQHQVASNGPKSGSHLVEMEPSFIYPSGAINALEKFVVNYLPHPAMSVNLDGKIYFVGSVTEMRDLLSVLAEFYLPKGSTRWSKQTMLVPRFKWGRTIETPAFINEASLTLETLRVAPLKSPLKDKPNPTPRRKTNKRAIRERGLHQKNYSHACETLLSLMMNKKQNGRTMMNSLKKSGPELPDLLSQFSATIAGTGLAVIFAVICKITYGRSILFGASKLVTIGLGVGLFWLSWAVNKLRETIVCIRKNSAKLGVEEEEEIVKKVEKNVNDIFFRVAALTAVAMLRLA